MPARLAAVRAEMTDIGGLVAVRVAAPHAVLRIGRVLEARAGAARVVDAEQEPVLPTLRERGDEGVVGVRDELRRGLEVCDGIAPALRDVLELPVPVELIPEQVPQADDLRSRPAHDLGQGELVHLEQAEVGAVRGEQRRGDAGGQVRAGGVPRKSPRRGEDRAGHRGRGRLAVRRRDERDALRKSRRESVERAGIELPHQLSGQRRASTASGGTRESPHQPGRRGLERESCTHAREGSGNAPLCFSCRMSRML